MDKRCSRRSPLESVAISIALLMLGVAVATGADPSSTLSADGWKESTHGRWSSRPERKVVTGEKGLSGEFVLPPGSGVAWEKKGNWDTAVGATLSFEFSADAANQSSEDYKEYETRFPVSVTVVFGKDTQDLSWKERVLDYPLKYWHGFPLVGIRLVYAYGNRIPVGSMYRTTDEETVFILAGEDEKGKAVKAVRNLKEDFLAAYGRLPKGPVTGIIVSAVRPSKERGNLTGRVLISLPGP